MAFDPASGAEGTRRPVQQQRPQQQTPDHIQDPCGGADAGTGEAVAWASGRANADAREDAEGGADP